MHKCAKCQSEWGFPVSIIGHYHAFLCQDCRNAYQEYMQSTPIYRDYNVIMARLAKTEGPNMADGLVHELIDIEKKLYSMAKSWMAEKKKESN